MFYVTSSTPRPCDVIVGRAQYVIIGVRRERRATHDVTMAQQVTFNEGDDCRIEGADLTVYNSAEFVRRLFRSEYLSPTSLVPGAGHYQLSPGLSYQSPDDAF
jgi:hypothetical protein